MLDFRKKKKKNKKKVFIDSFCTTSMDSCLCCFNRCQYNEVWLYCNLNITAIAWMLVRWYVYNLLAYVWRAVILIFVYNLPEKVWKTARDCNVCNIISSFSIPISDSICNAVFRDLNIEIKHLIVSLQNF
jgi:hypothetical protein